MPPLFFFLTSTASPRVSVGNHRKWECHKGHIVCIQLSASRIVTGSRWEPASGSQPP